MFEELVTDVFFDLDHTLWDFERNSALTFEKMLTDHHIDISLHEFLKVYVPTNLAFWKLYREDKITKAQLRYSRLKKVFDQLGYPVLDETIHSLSNEYIKHLPSHAHLFPDAVAILEYLRPKYRLHIITNGFQEVQESKLRNSGIHHYFDQIIDSEMAGVKKPNPLIFEMALDRARVSAQNSIMIGDSMEADILGAKSAGFHTLHFNAHREPHHQHAPIITALKEIKTYL